MCNWKSWIWPGLITTALLTVLTGWFLSGPVEQDLTARAGDILKTSQPWSTVSFDGRDATVSGVAENDTLKVAAAATALKTYGVRVVANAATLPKKADPFVLNLVKGAAGVTLKGNYATSESRAALVTAAEKALPGIDVKDELTLAAGKPDGFDALATFGIGQIADLTSGEVSLANMDYSIKGAAVDLPSYEKISAATAQLPAGGALKLADLAIPPLGRPYEFGAAMDGGTVNLSGYAPSMDVKIAIEADAKAAFPDKSVKNLLKLATGAPSNFGEMVKFGLGQMAILGNGSVSLVDSNYSIKGAPADGATFDALMKATAENLPAGATLAMADLAKPAEPVSPVVEPAQASAPYVWTAIASVDGVKIEGSVPSAEAAAKAMDFAKRRFVNTAISDAQTVLDGAPDGFADAQLNALKSLSYLSGGKAMIADKTVTIDGNVPSESAMKLVSAKAQSGMPAGYQLVTNVKVVEPVMVASAADAPKPYVWTATSNADGVKLEGSVLSGDVGKSIYDIAALSFAGKTVVNGQAPLNPSPAGFAAAQSEVLKGLSQLQEGAANMSDESIKLTGIATSEDVKAAVIKSMTDALPEGYKLAADISVATPSPSKVVPTPYTWMASSRANGVKLEGSVPSSEVGVAALDLASRRFVKTEIMNAQTVLAGAPDGFADAQTASLKALSYLTEGRAIHSDKSVEITGVAASEGIKALVIKNATAAMPMDYTLTTNIAVVEPAPTPEPTPVVASTDCIADIAAILNSEQIRFETNQATINEASNPLIAKIAATLANCPDKRVEIAGHTDSDGSDAYNKRLSHDRAHAVRRSLVSAGIPFARIIANGYGERQPIAENDTEENKAKNRRTEIRAVQ